MSLSWTAAFDPDEVKDYTINWASTLDSGDTISTSSWSLPSGATGLTEDSDAKTDSTTTIWLSVTDPGSNRANLVAGKYWALVNTIVTTGGRTYQRTVKLTVTEL